MAKSLAPAYLRLGGPDSNRYRYHFKRSLVNGAQHDNYTITGKKSILKRYNFMQCFH
jgi:hypothetical protein